MLGFAWLLVASAQAKSSNAGLVAVRYNGTVSNRFVYEPSDPSLWNTAFEFRWNETYLAILVGGNLRPLSSSLSVIGGERESYSSPNQPSCTSYFHRRKGSVVPVYVEASGTLVSAHAVLPVTGEYVQSTVADTKPCGVAVNSSPSADTSPSTPQTAAAEDPLVQLKYGGEPIDKDFDASPSDAQNKASLSATLKVTVLRTCQELGDQQVWGARTAAASEEFHDEVIAIRQSGQTQQAQIADVERISSSYLDTLKRAFEQDQRDLDQVKQQLLSSGCDPREIKKDAENDQSFLDSLYGKAESRPSKAIEAIKEGCGCGGFAPPNLF